MIAENAGYEVVSVDRGTSAIPFLEREHFDLLLSDISARLRLDWDQLTSRGLMIRCRLGGHFGSAESLADPHSKVAGFS